MKALFFSKVFFLLAVVAGFAQSGSHLMVVNGGDANANPPVFPTLQATDLTTGNSRVLATMRVSDVQDLEINYNRAYIAGSDSIFIYDLDSAAITATLFRKLHYPGVRRIFAIGDTIYAGKFNPTGSSLSVLRISTGQLLADIPTISGRVNDISFRGNNRFDFVQVLWSVQTKLAPIRDSISLVTVIRQQDFNTSNFRMYFTDLRHDRIFDTRHYLVASTPDSLKMAISYYGMGGVRILPFIFTNIKNAFGYVETPNNPNGYEGFIYGTNHLGQLFRTSWMLPWQRVIDTISDLPHIVNAIYDVQRSAFYVARTDYAGLNQLQHFNLTGGFIRNFTVGVNPKLMAFYRFNQILSVPEKQVLAQVKVYPNPAKDWVEVSGFTPESKIRYSLLSSEGKLLREDMLTGPIAVSGLPKGIYWLKLNHPNGAVRVLPLTKE